MSDEIITAYKVAVPHKQQQKLPGLDRDIARESKTIALQIGAHYCAICAQPASSTPSRRYGTMRAIPHSSSTSAPESTWYTMHALRPPHVNIDARLKGKTAIVTGGDSGIGRSAAIMFAMEGARGVTITYLPDEKPDAEDAAKAIEAAGAKALIVECNLEEESACRRLVDEHIKAFGTLNVLVNNASKQVCVPVLCFLDDVTMLTYAGAGWRRSSRT